MKNITMTCWCVLGRCSDGENLRRCSGIGSIGGFQNGKELNIGITPEKLVSRAEQILVIGKDLIAMILHNTTLHDLSYLFNSLF